MKHNSKSLGNIRKDYQSKLNQNKQKIPTNIHQSFNKSKNTDRKLIPATHRSTISSSSTMEQQSTQLASTYRQNNSSQFYSNAQNNQEIKSDRKLQNNNNFFSPRLQKNPRENLLQTTTHKQWKSIDYSDKKNSEGLYKKQQSLKSNNQRTSYDFSESPSNLSPIKPQKIENPENSLMSAKHKSLSNLQLQQGFSMYYSRQELPQFKSEFQKSEFLDDSYYDKKDYFYENEGIHEEESDEDRKSILQISRENSEKIEDEEKLQRISQLNSAIFSKVSKPGSYIQEPYLKQEIGKHKATKSSINLTGIQDQQKIRYSDTQLINNKLKTNKFIPVHNSKSVMYGKYSIQQQNNHNKSSFMRNNKPFGQSADQDSSIFGKSKINKSKESFRLFVKHNNEMVKNTVIGEIASHNLEKIHEQQINFQEQIQQMHHYEEIQNPNYNEAKLEEYKLNQLVNELTKKSNANKKNQLGYLQFLQDTSIPRNKDISNRYIRASLTFQQPMPLSYNISKFRCNSNEFHYFKIAVKGKECPLKLIICQKEQKQQSFKVFISNINEHPNKFNCDNELINQYSILLSEGQKKEFTFPFYYFSYVSNQDSVVQINYDFGAFEPKNTQLIENISANRQKEMRHTSTTLQRLKNIKSEDLKKQFDEIMRQKWQRNKKFIKAIKENLVHDIKYSQRDLRDEKINQQKQLNQLKQEQVHKKKLKKEKNEKKKLTQSIQERQLKKHILGQQRLQEIKKFKKNYFAAYWISIIQTTNVVRTLGRHLVKQQKLKKKMTEIIFLLKRPFFKYRYTLSLREQQTTVEERALMDTQQSLQLGLKTMKKIQQKKAVNVLVSLLSENLQPYQIKTKMIKYYYKARFVKYKFVTFHTKIIQYKQAVGIMWDKYLKVLMRSFILMDRLTDDQQSLFYKQCSEIEFKLPHIQEFFEKRQQEYYRLCNLKRGEDKQKFKVMEAFTTNKKNEKRSSDVNRQILSQIDRGLRHQRTELNFSDVNLQAKIKRHNTVYDSVDNIIAPELFTFPDVFELRKMIKRAIEKKKQVNPNWSSMLKFKEQQDPLMLMSKRNSHVPENLDL